MARYWQATGDLDEAARDACHAQWLLGRCRTPPVVPAADIALTLAEIERARDDQTADRAHLEYCLDLLEAAPEAGHRDRMLVRALTALGDCHRRAGRYREAGEVLDRALRSVERDGGAPDLLAAVLTVLGITAKELGEYDRAARHYARVHAIHRESGASRADAATLQHNLAGLEYSRGHYLRAEAHARHAVALRQASRATRVDLAADLAVLGSAVAGQHRYQEARDLFGQALEACRAARPPRQYEIAVHLHNLADLEQADGRPAQAEALYREALATKERLLGAGHPEVALVANNLGTLLHEQRRPEAADWFRRALAIVERAYPPAHPVTLRIRRNLDRLAHTGPEGCLLAGGEPGHPRSPEADVGLRAGARSSSGPSAVR
ncbi:tetratricopeptide repeat protein [Nonomuraea sp. NPDC003804]|uniref:tetratricopeptide repeat protein n=1 Tax=Nonomuraea sp. NPDC003804 TaxID=3154547 RepID=UPI0033AB8F42